VRQLPAAVVVFCILLGTLSGAGTPAESAAAEAVPAKVEPIAPDRPDFTDGVLIVDRVQLETGATLSRMGSRELSFADVFMRVPVSERLELHLGLAHIRDRDDAESASGLSNSFLGAKYQLQALDDGKIGIAVIAGTTLPTGASSVSEPGGLQPLIKVALAKEFTEHIGLGVNVGYAYEKDDGVRVSDFFASASLNISLTQRLGSFVEVWMCPIERGGTRALLSPVVVPRHGRDGGRAWGLGHRQRLRQSRLLRGRGVIAALLRFALAPGADCRPPAARIISRLSYRASQP
jgi:hypothetical protein